MNSKLFFKKKKKNLSNWLPALNAKDNEIMDDNQILTEIIPVSLSPLGWGYLPTVEPLCILPGSSVMRDVILTRLQTLGVQRPPVNIERRRKELHEINLM